MSAESSILKKRMMLIAVAWCVSICTTSAQLDLNADGMSDIWQNKYQIDTASAQLDFDGDGQSNILESLAGTDPHDALSTLILSQPIFESNSVLIGWESRFGTSYQLYGSRNLDKGTWSPIGERMVGPGGPMNIAIVPEDNDKSFFRVSAFNETPLPIGVEVERDSDGDGQSDIAEISTGNNPFDTTSLWQDPSVEFSPSFTVSWKSERGKSYLIESRELSPSSSWQSFGAIKRGTGHLMTTSIAVPDELQREYRVSVQDLDSDEDGLSDWEEDQLGLDPLRADTDTRGAGDLIETMTRLNAANLVAIETAHAVANITRMEQGGFNITRTGGLDAIQVGYTVSGSAAAGSDYVTLSGVVDIPFGVNSVTIPVDPIESSPIQMTESIELTLLDQEAYDLDQQVTAQVNVIREVALNVRDYGALGDGTTDDTLAIQSAINAFESSATHNTLHFPSGQYRLNTTYHTVHTANTSSRRILILGQNDLSGRDLMVTGEPGAVLYSTASPVRAKTLLILAKFRSLEFRGLRVEKDAVPLSGVNSGIEPNGAAGITLIDYDDRVIESVVFKNCVFYNCHRSITLNTAAYPRRGLLKKIGFYDCSFLNPFGSNTENATNAFGGGQQLFITAWADLAEYTGNIFDGAGDAMTPENSSDGRAKDGCHFGSPLRFVFVDNVVRRMRVEGILQTDHKHLLGTVKQTFVMPPPDGATEVEVSLSLDPGPVNAGEFVGIRQKGSTNHNVLRVVGVNRSTQSLDLVNDGYVDNIATGELVETSRQVFLQRDDPPTSYVANNYFFDAAAIAVRGHGVVTKNFLYDSFLLIYRSTTSPLYSYSRGLIFDSNVIRNSAGIDVYTCGVYSQSSETVIRNNMISVDRADRFIGIRLAGSNAIVEGNIVSADQGTGFPYFHPSRALGVGLQFFGAGSRIENNTTKRFTVGVGPEVRNAIISHTVFDHVSIDDETGVDPRGVEND